MVQLNWSIEQKERWLEAATLADEFVEADSEWAEAWNRRATLRYLMGQYQGSLDDIADTLKREPRHFGALSGRGLVLNALGRPAEAALARAEAQAVMSGEQPEDEEDRGISADL